MKSHQSKKPKKPEKTYVVTEGNIQMNLEEIPNIEWKFLISDLLPGIEEFYSDPANQAAFEASKGA